jgi:hypothetical protein
MSTSMRTPVIPLPAFAAAAALLLCLCLASECRAAGRECDGVSFPQQIQARGKALTLNGVGLRKATFLRIKVYVGALYVAHPTADANAIINSRDPVEIDLAFVFHATAGQFRDAWEEGFKRSAPDKLPQLRARITELENRTTAVDSGQRVSFLRIPGVGVQFSLDGVVQGTIPGDDFGTAFLGIWLGPSPPNPELRTGLLGGPCT